MGWRLIRLDAYFLQGTNWVEIGQYDTSRIAIREAEKLYYGGYTAANLKEIPLGLNYQLDLTLFWIPETFGGYRSYFTMHNRPYTAKYVVLPMTISDVVSQTFGRIKINA